MCEGNSAHAQAMGYGRTDTSDGTTHEMLRMLVSRHHLPDDISLVQRSLLLVHKDEDEVEPALQFAVLRKS
jgi:hypothetical protein